MIDEFETTNYIGFGYVGSIFHFFLWQEELYIMGLIKEENERSNGIDVSVCLLGLKKSNGGLFVDPK